MVEKYRDGGSGRGRRMESKTKKRMAEIISGLVKRGRKREKEKKRKKERKT